MAKREGGQESEGPSGDEERPADDFVRRRRPDPSQPPQAVLELMGLLGDSDRADFRRLYFTRDLNYYAEFRAEDVIETEPIPAEQAPFLGVEATRVALKRDATIEYTRTRRARPLDEFDLDVQLGPTAVPGPVRMQPATWEAECPGPTWGDCPTSLTCRWCGDTWQITVCRGRTCVDVGTCDTCRPTCVTCQTCPGQTCHTCPGQATCQTCPGQATCWTCPGQATCQTCETCPGQATCQTCETCGRTCLTCDTCNPHVFTCRPGPQCP
jgi:hypothetical protein